MPELALPSPLRGERSGKHTLVRFDSEETWSQVEDVSGWLAALDHLYATISELLGMPLGVDDRLVYQEALVGHGALWSAGYGEPYDIGIATDCIPGLITAINRRPIAAALIHEMGHIATRWDWCPETGRSYMLWPGAVEGMATPIGAYVVQAHGVVPSNTDYLDSSRDWLTAADFANEGINAALCRLEEGVTGQQSVDLQGHSEVGWVLEAVTYDLLFRFCGSYQPLRSTIREFVASRTPEVSERSDLRKMNEFYVLLGRHMGYNLARYLESWGFDVRESQLALADLPVLDRVRPAEPLPVRYVTPRSSATGPQYQAE